MLKTYFVFCIIYILSGYILCQEKALKKNPCSSKKYCDECIVTHQKCAWCQKEDYGTDGKPRCDLIHNLVERGCESTYIVNPQNSLLKLSDKSLSNMGTVDNFVQIAPQSLKIKIRPKTPLTFKVNFRQAEDYPVDLYYLMDLSNSMEDDKEKLALLGDLLGSSMRNITTNFRLGFGSFVDKIVMPYVSIVPEKIKRPCDQRNGEPCAAPYGFKNHLSLTSDTSRFAAEIKNAPVSGNLDAPEGGLDALMQAIVCREEIGWRPEARNLIIFSTDASVHFAGDGKLGGIVKPNDGQCHLDSRGLYTESSTQDYPSVSQIIQKVREKSVNIIFAITGEQLPIYQRFNEILEGSTVGKLANDSSNIVELVKENYNKITSKVEMKDTAPANLTISYSSSCLGSVSKKTKVCEGLKVGDTVSFDVTLTLESCLPDKLLNVKINPVGIGEILNIQIETMCDCPCALPGISVPHSPKCSDGHGTFECGTCKCDDNRFGRFCECDASSLDRSITQGQPGTTWDNTARCRPPVNALNNSSFGIFRGPSMTSSINTNSGPVCSGRGECVCGVCECWPRDTPNDIVSGEFCQCDNFSCDRYEGKICGGKDRGTCECGECVCKEMWQGDACECPSTNLSCTASNGKLCNGVGICDCGVCVCDAQSRYRGPTCEECPTCPGLCSENRACVQCHVFQTGPYRTKADCDNNCPVVPIVVDELVDTEENGQQLSICQFKDDDDCTFFFTYSYDAYRNLVIKVQKSKACPPQPAILTIILPIVVGIIFIGLICLLVWKLVTWLHDTREFAKFQKDRENAKWDTGENPIFRQATSTYRNPTFRKNRL